MFPFRLHPSQGAPLLTTSFSCPTVIANAGATLDSQLEDLSAMTRSWQEAWPEAPRPLQWVQGHAIEGATVGTIRTWLLRLLETPSEDGSPDLRASVARIADRLEDWTRYRVLKLEPAAFDEYLELTGRHAASSPSRHRAGLPPAWAAGWAAVSCSRSWPRECRPAGRAGGCAWARGGA